jgi:signal transduction histidine kinase
VKREYENPDPRVKRKRHTWIDYATTYIVLLVLSAGQAMILAVYMGWGRGGQSMPLEFIFGMLGYWAIVSAVFVFLTARHKVRDFDVPMRELSKAAKDVARGDFSVTVKPHHATEKYDYVDVMFEDFNKMVEELGSIETLKSDFIANVSHEVRTPLAIIQNYATVLQSDALTDEQRRYYAETIANATTRLSELVTNILKLNKLENQEIVPETTPFDLCRQLAECAVAFSDAWERKNIDFSVDMDDKCVINADEGMLQLVWQNLLSNAVKFTDNGGKITLTQTMSANGVTVTVADSGCGMGENTLAHIFDKFYQGDTSRASEGNGLGLALALRVIELLKGSITVNSRVGKGSTFTVILPIKQ